MVVLAVNIGFWLPARPVMAAGTVPTDVSPNSPAYKAVKLLIDKGYLQLYQDQTFQGDQPVERFTFAVVVAKILDAIASGQVTSNKEDMSLITKITNEYRNDLVDAVRKVDIFNKSVAELKKKDQILEEDLTKNLDEYQQQAKQMIVDIVALSDRIQKLENENIKLKSEVELLRENVANINKWHKYGIIAALVLGLIGASK
jgi:hypothetical protein